MAKRKRSSFKACMRSKLKGRHFRTKRAQKAAFKMAAKSCGKKRRHR